MIDQIRKHAERKVPIRKISESLGISRNTVRRYLRKMRQQKSGEPSK